MPYDDHSSEFNGGGDGEDIHVMSKLLGVKIAGQHIEDLMDSIAQAQSDVCESCVVAGYISTTLYNCIQLMQIQKTRLELMQAPEMTMQKAQETAEQNSLDNMEAWEFLTTNAFYQSRFTKLMRAMMREGILKLNVKTVHESEIDDMIDTVDEELGKLLKELRNLSENDNKEQRDDDNDS